MVDFLADDAILLVFLVVALGAGLGAVRVKGVALGPAAALFVGLAVGAVDESLSAAEGLGVLRALGLVLFTYTVGLASGPTFFAGFRRGGAQAVGLTVALVVALAGVCALVAEVLDLSAADNVADHAVVFEVDGLDEEKRTGWSVCVHGFGQEITDPVNPGLTGLQTMSLLSWAPGERDRWFAIRAHQLTGRRIPVTTTAQDFGGWLPGIVS